MIWKYYVLRLAYLLLGRLSLRSLYGIANVVGTGGWAELFARETEIFDVVDPDLTLHGLRLIYETDRG